MIDRGPQDKGVSFWDAHTDMHIREKLTQHCAPGYIFEGLAHESSHETFQLSGLLDNTFGDASDILSSSATRRSIRDINP